MSAPHPVAFGYVAACQEPEGRGWYHHYENCRACLTAAVAQAVNKPLTRVDAPGRINCAAPLGALLLIRSVLDECDTLRVRAEQVLLPLVGAEA